MNELLQNLLKLQTLEFDEIFGPETEKRIDELCARIPPRILAHHDHLMAQGKKGLAAVRNQVCGGCHMHVPRALVLALMQGNEIQVCVNCGRYLYLPELDEPEAPRPRKVAKVSANPRPHRELLHAV